MKEETKEEKSEGEDNEYNGRMYFEGDLIKATLGL